MKAGASVTTAAAAVGLAASSIAWAQSTAERAVEAAKYAGAELSIVWEAGLQSLDPLNFFGPKWDALTGRIGVDKQRAAYQDWAGKPNAYPR